VKSGRSFVESLFAVQDLKSHRKKRADPPEVRFMVGLGDL